MSIIAKLIFGVIGTLVGLFLLFILIVGVVTIAGAFSEREIDEQ